MPRKSRKITAPQGLGALGASVVVLLGILTLSVVTNAFALSCPGKRLFLAKSTVCVEIADTSAAWQKGLAERDALPKGRGMLFVFPDRASRTFWMKGMRFPLDMVWILDGRVIGWQAHVAPDGGVRLIQTPPVDAVLEVNAGEVERLGIRVGERVSW